MHEKEMNRLQWLLAMLLVLGVLSGAALGWAANKVVVVPLGGFSGDATSADVIHGRTFSSKAAGKGAVGSLKIRDGAVLYTNSIGMEFSLIPAGSFIMGSPDGSGDTDHPPVRPAEDGRDSYEKQHQVTLTKSFYMQTTEVTQAQWEMVMGSGTNPAYFASCGPDCPVEQVSWFDAQNFIDALNALEQHTNCNTIPNSCYALPTEAQWEYAARAGTVTAFYNGDILAPTGNDANLNKIAWYGSNAGGSTHPVARLAANSLGLYDMAGNVREWCQDWGGDYPDNPVTEPGGPASGVGRVNRGGDWSDLPAHHRSAMRFDNSPSFQSKQIGFRLVLPSGP